MRERKPLATMWAVVITNKHGDWTAVDCMGRTRSEAIDGFVGAARDHELYGRWRDGYERDRRRGHVRCVRVQVTEVPDA